MCIYTLQLAARETMEYSGRQGNTVQKQIMNQINKLVRILTMVSIDASVVIT